VSLAIKYGLPSEALKDNDHFGKAFLIGAVLEALLIGGILFGNASKPIIVKPVPKIIAIHMIHPAPPKPQPKPVPPPPKPVVHPKPVPKPLPMPVPKPIPVPVVQPPLPPKPLLAKTAAPQAPVYTPPATPTSPPIPVAPSPAARQAALDAYAAMIRARVQAETRVPESVRLMHLSGTATVTFRLTPSGQLLWAKITGSSGIGVINRAALKSVREANYPPFTKKMPKRSTDFTVLVHLSAHGAR